MLVLISYNNEIVKNSNYIHIYTNKLTKSILNDEFKIPKTVLQEHASHKKKMKLKLYREDRKECSHLMKNSN